MRASPASDATERNVASSPETALQSSPPSMAAAVRVRLAVRADTSMETLRELAQDSDILVRAAVAINRGCLPEIDTILAADEDDRVRALLGCRIARLLPELDGAGQSTATSHVMKTLSALAQDQASRVRRAIAQEISSMDAAPHDLVLLLARDEAIEVSDQVLRLSPVLTDTDLLKLIATPPTEHTAELIASRSQLSTAVADSIVAHAGAPAIRALLNNHSACIQEATLDALVGRAPQHAEWHGPLVRRPHLSFNAIRALSEFIAADLLRVMVQRVDLDPAKLEAVRQRLAFETASDAQATLVAEARRLKERGALTEDLLLEAANIGHVRRVAVLLAVAADVSFTAVDRAVELRSAKALVSLAWRAGFSMRAGTAVQTSLAHFSPDHLLMATVSGGFPLSQEEMEWQMELMEAIETLPMGAA